MIRASQGYHLAKADPRIRLQQYDNLQVVLLELLSGKIDAMIAPDTTVRGIAQAARLEDKITVTKPYLFELKRALAVNRNNPELFQRIKGPTERFVVSQRYQNIFTKWYGTPVPYWTTRRVLTVIGGMLALSIVTLLFWRYRVMQATIRERTRTGELLHDKTVRLEEEIAERQKAQEALEALNSTLEERIAAAVADLRRKDELLIHQSRLAAMGELLNSIAHQWRQPLNNVAVCVQSMQFLQQRGELTEEEMKNQIGMVMETLHYMSHAIDDFRSFFRQDREQQEFVVREVIERCLNLIRSALEAANITVTVSGDATVRAIGFPNEYAQALMNVLYNARDALLERAAAGPRIEIVIGRSGARSMVTVQDNGGGIAPAVMPQIFEPYFTTKGAASGTGIGLYMARTLIERNMGGRITARNIEGGTEFTIEL